MRLADLSVRLKTLQVKAPYRGINKLPAEPVVMIYICVGYNSQNGNHLEDFLLLRAIENNAKEKHIGTTAKPGLAFPPVVIT